MARLAVHAADITLGTGYWSGAPTPADATVTVADTGTAIESVTLDYTLPAGVRLAGATGCPIMCALGPGATATVALHLVVDPTAWRTAPLRATVSAHAMVAGRPELPAASATATFTVLLPPGPPSPRVSLAAADLALPAGDGTAALTVRIGNTGPVPAQAALDVVTPDGTQVAAVPADCLASRRLGAHTDRCDVGRLDPGQRKALSFTLAVSPAALAQAPLSGAVMGYLTPTGQDTASVQAGYRITVLSQPAPSPTPAPAGSVESPPAPRQITDTFTARSLSVTSIVGGVVGLTVVVGLFVLFSLRRRLHDEADDDVGGSRSREWVEPRGAAPT